MSAILPCNYQKLLQFMEIDKVLTETKKMHSFFLIFETRRNASACALRSSPLLDQQRCSSLKVIINRSIRYASSRLVCSSHCHLISL